MKYLLLALLLTGCGPQETTEQQRANVLSLLPPGTVPVGTQQGAWGIFQTGGGPCYYARPVSQYGTGYIPIVVPTECPVSEVPFRQEP